MNLTKLAAVAALAMTALAHPAASAAHQATQSPAEPAVALTGATILSYAGTYKTDRGMEAQVIASLDGTLSIQLNSPPLAMRPLSQTEFAVDAKNGRITFDVVDGKVRGFTVRQG